MTDTVCQCWTDDIWKFIHMCARVSTLKSINEKGAFLCLIGSINRIISCKAVEETVNQFIEHQDNRFANFANSNDRVFFWTHLLRNAICEVTGETPPSFNELNNFYNPRTLTKDVWGPYGWRILHVIPLRARMINGKLPQSIGITLKAFITCVALLLPCPKCQKHAWEYYSTHDIEPYLSSNLHVFQWTSAFHNSVNERLNKEEGYQKKLYTPVEALQLYVDVPEESRTMIRFKN